MQTYSLTIDKFLDHAAKWNGQRGVVSAGGEAGVDRLSYGALRRRANLLSGALGSLGLSMGDCIGTLGWNTQHHLEVYYASMGCGLVCHTLNPRLTPSHLAAMINEAEDRVIAAASSLADLVAALLPLCPVIEHVIWLDGDGPAKMCCAGEAVRFWPYETLLQSCGKPVAWGGFDENTPAGLCYTSGTTGRPKGVLYTHRSNYLHTLRALQADAIALTGQDTVLVAVPMFHANGWGLPFAAPAVGAQLVLPGRRADGASLAKLMREEGVTLAAGVQTIWVGVMDHLDETGGELPDLKRVLIGGSKCPDSLIRRMETRLGVEVQTSWGMTELSPVGTIAPPGAPAQALQSSGRPPLGLDLKLTDRDGRELAEQRNVVGHLKVKGASVLDRYFRADTDALDEDGYFDTGDLASLDDDGNLTICGRAKDLIKSGGEWINPAEIEEIVGRHPDVCQVAVIGRADPKWGERPVLIVEPNQGMKPDQAALQGVLRGQVADWWIPDQLILVDAMPLAPTGKIDKRRLRLDYATAG
ncbi:AMP-binding protein [Maricaulis sp.]|uniref:AMP-binding protein n=1 Tax=Maricaulis sp. TaxID=1486257 RepID=UPI001B2164DE|nr:AMP-binding protein [Maricaulis sp.]MBO6763875.1 AMP-binding protein [Maricaulis sp.]